jgi:hypothetical protein
MTRDNCPPSECDALRQRVAELERERDEARSRALEEAAKLCEQHSRFYELHPEAAVYDPLEFQGAYSTGALKCAQIIREHQAEAGKEAGG